MITYLRSTRIRGPLGYSQTLLIALNNSQKNMMMKMTLTGCLVYWMQPLTTFLISWESVDAVVAVGRAPATHASTL